MQFDSITSPIDHGLTLLEAGAGTGKTYSLVRIIARQLVEKQIPIDQILTVTFTRAATAEIKGRLHELLGEVLLHLKHPPEKDLNDLAKHWIDQGSEMVTQAISILSLSLANFDSVPIFTIDGFFQRLLKEYAFESQVLFSVELDTDEQTLIETAMRDYWRQYVYPLDKQELNQFNKQISYKDACDFISQILRSGDVQLDSSYLQAPAEMLEHYQGFWDAFVSRLGKHRASLESFVTTPFPGIKKTFAPFKSNTTAAFFSEVDSILAKPETALLDIGRLNYIAGAKLFQETAFNKGKHTDLREHELGPLFESIDVLNQEAPKNLKSAYLGAIYQYVSQRLKQLKEERNIQSYNDVTQTLATLLSADSQPALAMKAAIKKNYQAVLIDEFQDTSPQQCSVFLNLFKHSDRYFHIIGDPKQSIYRFRGADVYSYIKAKGKADSTYNLQVNHRSSPRMIHAVNQLFSMADDPFLTDKEISFTPALWPDQNESLTPPEGEPSFFFHPLDKDLKTSTNFKNAICKSICAEVIQLLGTPWETLAPHSGRNGVVVPSDIAILVYSGNEGAALNNELSKLQVPVASNTRSSLLQSEEAIEVLSILTAMLEPWRSGALRSALLTVAMGSGKMLVDHKEFDKVTNLAAELHEVWNTHGLMPMMLDLVQQFEVRTTLLSLNQGKRRITNFMHLIELLDNKARQQKFTPQATLQWLEMAIQGSIIDLDSAVLELRIATDDAALQILTQHSSKGLEFPIVFATPPCARSFSRFVKPDLSYHDPKSFETYIAPYDDESSPSYAIRKKEACADRARLAYVALTRAKYLCHFYFTPEEPKKTDEHAVFQMLGEPDSEDFEALEQASSGCIKCDSIDADIFELTIPHYSPASDEEKPELSVRSTDGIYISRNQRTTSFSSITHHQHHFTDDGQDNDSEVINLPMAPDQGFWKKLQAGASLGSAFHEIMEEIDFKDPQNLKTLIQEKLTAYSPWKETPSDDELAHLVDEISTNINQLLAHPCDDNLCLAQLSLDKRLIEPEFLLSGSDFTLSSLCDILASDPPEGLPANYIETLRNIPSAQFEGFLVGFIDLIFEHEGKYHVLDWKTNRIPNNSKESLCRIMADHHYYLQYHVYSLALDRLLSQRLGSAYSPEQHLGKVYYVFFRGIDPEVPTSGVFTDQISPTRLTALRNAFNKTATV